MISLVLRGASGTIMTSVRQYVYAERTCHVLAHADPDLDSRRPIGYVIMTQEVEECGAVGTRPHPNREVGGVPPFSDFVVRDYSRPRG